MTGCCTQRRLSAQCRVSTVREEVEGLRLGGGNENPLRQQLRQGVVGLNRERRCVGVQATANSVKGRFCGE